MTRIYRYVLMHDEGMAPNPRHGLITLATCKPSIRRTASVGDWIIGCFPSPLNRLIAWAGRVESCIPIGNYPIEHPDREDALYSFGPEGFIERIKGKHPWYHTGMDEKRKDMTGNALVFDKQRSWHFGAEGRYLPDELAHLAAHGQGHRVNERRSGDLEHLEDWLIAQCKPGIFGVPRHGWADPCSGPCAPKPSAATKRRSC